MEEKKTGEKITQIQNTMSETPESIMKRFIERDGSSKRWGKKYANMTGFSTYRDFRAHVSSFNQQDLDIPQNVALLALYLERMHTKYSMDYTLQAQELQQ